MKERAINLAKQWTQSSYLDQEDRNDIQQLLDDPQKNENEIIERFYQNLEFGTGGLRNIIGIGSNRINKYNIRKAAQAMANVALETNSSELKACVSYDNRKFSKEFAKEVASVFAANGIKAFIFDQLTPTPMLSYAVRYYQAICGAMITASHNPKEYNGFKAYWSDGAQVTPPQDQKIIDAYNKIEEWEQIKSLDFEKAQAQGLIEWINEDCNESFYSYIENHLPQKELSLKHGDKVHFIYTPLHGCGHIPCEKISKRLGYTRFEIVQSQAVSDANFSTLATTPNPEDPKALELAVALMKEANADVAYGTDPDCDRLGVVVNHKGIEHFLNGNQIALLMLDYIFTQLQLQNKIPPHPIVLKSIVTSPLQETIAKSFKAKVVDTLTGFKWMAHKWKELEESHENYSFIFASEESFGYMPFDHVRDKDAVAAIALMNEITLHYKLQNKTLIDALYDIYEKYGYAQESLIALNYSGLSGKEKITKIMNYFRTHKPSSIANNKIKIFKDYLSLKEKDINTGEEKKLTIHPSNVLGFEFENGNKLFLRPSGTEPKIKFYTMVQVQTGDLKEKQKTAQKQIKDIEDFILNTIESI